MLRKVTAELASIWESWRRSSCASYEQTCVTTITIYISDIPKYLHSSEFYLSLDLSDSDSLIEIPYDCYQAHDHASTLPELLTLLRSMEFWGYDRFPDGVIHFCYTNDYSVWGAEIVRFNGLCNYLKTVFSAGAAESLSRAIEVGKREIILYLVSTFFRVDKTDSLVAVNCDHLLDLNRNLVNKDRQLPRHWSCYIMDVAARCDDIWSMELLYANGYKWDQKTCAEAARCGQLHCLQYAHKNGCTWNESIYKKAASNGHISCMEYAFQNGLWWGIGRDVCVVAALSNQVECLKYAHEHGCPWDRKTTIAAAKRGALDCLRYALENGCPIGEQACTRASGRGSIACLQLLHEHEAPWDEATPAAAAERNHLDCLQYVFENACPWDMNTTRLAALRGCFDTLVYAMDNDCPHPRDLMITAASAITGSLPCVKYLIEEQGLYMEDDGSVFGAALMRGDFECVHYLLDSGCPCIGFEFDTNKVAATVTGELNEFDGNFAKCIEYAVHRGWTCNDNLIEFVCEQELSQCARLMLEEGVNDGKGVLRQIVAKSVSKESALVMLKGGVDGDKGTLRWFVEDRSDS